MNMHKNARLTPLGRKHVVRQVLSGQTPEAAARAAGVCRGRCEAWSGPLGADMNHAADLTACR